MYPIENPTERFLNAAKTKNQALLFATYVFNKTEIDINALDRENKPALYYALLNKHQAMMNFLLMFKADYSMVCEIGGKKISLLEFADQQGLLHVFPSNLVYEYRQQKYLDNVVCGR